MIGIDIGSKYIKVCKINKNKKNEIDSILCAQTAKPVDIMSQAKQIEELLRRIRVKKDDCFLAVGGKDLICRDMLVPKNIDRKRLKNIVMLEVAQTAGEDMTKKFFSYTLMNSTVENKDKVFYTFATRQMILSKINIIQRISGLTLKGVTLEDFALSNSFEAFGPAYKNNETVLIANIGFNKTNIIVLKNKELVFMRDIDFGGNDITKDIMSSYSVPDKLGEELKKRTEMWEEIGLNIRNSLKKSSAVMLETIFRTIEHCITRQYITSVDRIIITGGGAKLSGMDSFMEETLGIPTVIWNPLEDMKLKGYINKDYGCFVPIALGLALETGE